MRPALSSLQWILLLLLLLIKKIKKRLAINLPDISTARFVGGSQDVFMFRNDFFSRADYRGY